MAFMIEALCTTSTGIFNSTALKYKSEWVVAQNASPTTKKATFFSGVLDKFSNILSIDYSHISLSASL